jgi:hypothetical protein
MGANISHLMSYAERATILSISERRAEIIVKREWYVPETMMLLRIGMAIVGERSLQGRGLFVELDADSGLI